MNGHALDAIIDTGADIKLIELDAARRAGLHLDAPHVKRLGDLSGMGKHQAARWRAAFGKLAIGADIIRHARLHVMVARGARKADLLLGRDFSAHAPGFARHQPRETVSLVSGRRPVCQHRRRHCGVGPARSGRGQSGCRVRRRDLAART